MIVGNAPWRWSERTVAVVRAADLVVAADGGANHLARIGVCPAAVVGDLDSLLPGVRAWVGEERIVPRPDQERTDLDKTLAYVLELGAPEEILVLAAAGGRLDHALENLGLLGRWALAGGPETALLDERHRISAVTGRRTVTTVPGQGFSLLPLGRCEGVSVAGARWPLAGEPLDLLGRTGISNQALGESLVLTVEHGVLLLFLAHPGDW